jgi:hypothetical protein
MANTVSPKATWNTVMVIQNLELRIMVITFLPGV